MFRIARKWHRNGIKKPRSHRYESLKGVSISVRVSNLFRLQKIHQCCFLVLVSVFLQIIVVGFSCIIYSSYLLLC